MEFQELSEIWKKSDENFDKSIQIKTQIFKEVSVQSIKSKLTEIKWTSIFQIVVGLFFFEFLLGFIIEHYNNANLLLASSILLAITIYSLIFDGYLLSIYFGLNAKHSVYRTQKSLGQLDFLQKIDTKSLLVIIPLFSAPFLIVAAKAFLNIEVSFLDKWIIKQVIGSFVVAIILVYIMLKFPDKGLQEAMKFLRELKDEH